MGCNRGLICRQWDLLAWIHPQKKGDQNHRVNLTKRHKLYHFPAKNKKMVFVTVTLAIVHSLCNLLDTVWGVLYVILCNTLTLLKLA